MGSLSDFSENALMAHIFNAAYVPPTAVYLALGSADPGEAGTGASFAEVAATYGYARQVIAFGAAAARRIPQNADVPFPQAAGAWGQITHWAICDSSVRGAGNILASGVFAAPLSPVAGNTPKIASGQVYVEISASAGGAGFPTWLVNKLLDLMFRHQAYASPAASLYLALLNAAATDAATTMAGLTEVAGVNYARKKVNQVGGAAPKWSAISGGAIENADDITFATPGAGGWTQMVGVAIVDALAGTSANVIAYDNTNVVDQTPAEADTVYFPAGAFDCSLS